jgi:GrpB-like predicted nucleotidyltransferase (UPF0157 family)
VVLAVPVVQLLWSDDLLEQARRTRDDVAVTLARLGVPGELELTGGSSLPGALTKGDIDLHLRVAPTDFDPVVAVLTRLYRRASPEAWADTLAVFDVDQPLPRPTGIAVTPVGSVHDRRFRTTWQVLRRDPRLLERYNALKRAASGTDDYEEAKSAFFTEVCAPSP